MYESETFYCYPPIDYLPDPNALLITGITPKDTYLKGMNEFYFSKKIFDIFRKPNTCIVGFNNISFDDEITRNIFYRNLLDPYEWSWKNGNSRWDIINVIRTCCALRPEGITWPKNSKGLNSFKLFDLTDSNNIEHKDAHQALSDVIATFKLAKLIKNKKRKLFSFLLHNRFKKNLKKIVNVTENIPIIYISSFFGAKENNFSIIVPIFWNINNVNCFIAINLMSNIKELMSFVKENKFKESRLQDFFLKGIISVYINKCPILIPMNVLKIKDFIRLKIDYNLYIKNLMILKQNNYLKKEIEIMFSKIHFFSSKNVDLQIYDSFFSSKDKVLIKKYRKNFFNISNFSTKYFEDLRIKEIIFRCKARNFPHMLNNSEKNKWKSYCIKFFKEKNIKLYIEKINYLIELEKKNEKNIFLLKSLSQHATNIVKFLISM